jgi:hypothetical protein
MNSQFHIQAGELNSAAFSAGCEIAPSGNTPIYPPHL